jgi:hypothetical protein
MAYEFTATPRSFFHYLNHGLRLASFKAFNSVSWPAANCELAADMNERRLYNSVY